MRDEEILLNLLCREVISELGVSFKTDDDKNDVVNAMLDEETREKAIYVLLEVLGERLNKLSIKYNIDKEKV